LTRKFFFWLNWRKEEFPHEAEWQGKDKIMESWPDKGELKMENFSLRYRKNLPPALNDLSITIKV
jgi:ABC-type bacteriocin/lantibiotic exporter with double-glycine peptidase domain